MRIFPYLQDGVASPVSVIETSPTKHHALGTRGIIDGRSFRYARSVGSAIATNVLCQAPAPVANHIAQTGALTNTTVVGSTLVTAVLGATAAYADEYLDGLLKIQSATTGAGQAWVLNNHAAVASAGTATLFLDSPVLVATSGTTTWSLVHNTYGGIVINPTTRTANPAGVNLVAWGAGSTTPQYGWLQTWGECSVLSDVTAGSLVAGGGIVADASVAGAVTAELAASVSQRVGVAIEALATDAVYASVYLTIAP